MSLTKTFMSERSLVSNSAESVRASWRWVSRSRARRWPPPSPTPPGHRRLAGVVRAGSDALLREFPQLGGIFQILAVRERPEQQALIRLAFVRFDRGVIEAKLGEVREDDKEDLPGVPDVVLGLDNVSGVVKRFDGGLGLDEEFGLAGEAEAVIGTAFGVG